MSAVGTHSFAPLVNEKNASTYIHLGNVVERMYGFVAGIALIAVLSFLAPSNGR